MNKEVTALIRAARGSTVLDLSNQGLTMLPASVGQLSRLESLFLEGNRLTSLPGEIGNLVNLRRLDLRDNRLTALPPEFKRLTNLTELRLEGNPLPIPPEILSLAHRPAQIIDFYLQHQPEQSKPLNEAKMMIVGQGGVGKTSLATRLIEGVYDTREATQGIEINRLRLNVDGEEVSLNVWDFGGQEIMHATHQFFFTRRSLYLLVLDARLTVQESRGEYWLKLIQSLGGDSPVIVVVNKADVAGPGLDGGGLFEKYKNIRAFVTVSCRDGTGFAKLKQRIAAEVGTLPYIHDRLPGSWLEVKSRLEATQVDYIPLRAYSEMCLEAGITDRPSQRTLLGFLHDLGTVLNFQDDARLRGLIIIKPEWLVQAVYKILNSRKVLENRGVLRLEWLSHILYPAQDSEGERSFILGVMERFELGFAFEDRREFLIPDLLPAAAPDLNWDRDDSLAFEYHYNFLPQSVITRLIVRLRKYIYQSTYWRNGVVFRHRDNHAVVRADMEDKKVSIQVTGRLQTRRALLTLIRSALSDIHQTFPGLEVKAKVPLPQYPEVVVDYEHLLNLERLGEKTFIPEGLMEPISVRGLLGDIEPVGGATKGRVETANVKKGQERADESSKVTSDTTLPPIPDDTSNWWSRRSVSAVAYALLLVTMAFTMIFSEFSDRFIASDSTSLKLFVLVLNFVTSLLVALPALYIIELRSDPAYRDWGFGRLWLEAFARVFGRKGPAAESQRWDMYPLWSQQIRDELLETNRARLTRFPRDLRRRVGEQFMNDFANLNLTFDRDGMKLKVSELARLDAFRDAWEGARRLIEANSIEKFRDETDRLTELFCEAVAFERIGDRATLGRLYGQMIDVSNPAFELQVNVRPEFPLLYACKRSFSDDDVRNATGLMNRFGVGEDGFALLVAFEKDQALRQLVRNSPHKNDFTVLNREQLWELLAAKSPVQHLQQLILEQIDLVAVSPYTTAGPVSGKGFFGRAKEEETLTKNIRRNDFALLANRRMGKTSLLERVVGRLGRTEHYQVFHCDLQTSHDYRTFYRKLMKKHPELGAGGRSGEPSGEDFAGIVERVKARDDSQIIFVFDEVDELLAYDVQHKEQLFKTFRSLAQREQVRFIFSGTTTLVERAHNPDSPLFNFCKVVKLGLLDERSARDLVTVPMRSIGVTFEDEEASVARILAVSARHPNLIQAICERLVDRINDNQRRVITVADLNQVIDSDDFYTFFEELVWGNATEMEKLIVYTMWGREGFTADEATTALAAHGLSAEAVKNSLNTLEIYSILSRDGGRYSFTYGEFRSQIKARNDISVLAEQSLQEVLNQCPPS